MSVVFSIRNKLPFPILVLNSLKITHARTEKKRGPWVTEQAMKINKIKTKGNHSTISGLVKRASVERALASCFSSLSLSFPSINESGHKPDPRGLLGRWN